MATTAKTAKKTAEAKAPKTAAIDTKTVEDFLAKGTEQAQEQFAKAQVSVEEVTEFHRENTEVLVETATLAQKGFEALAAEATTFNQKSYDDGIAVAKQAMASTNVQEAFELQTEFAKTAVDAYLGHMKKMGEMFQASAQEAFAPLNTRVTTIVETAQKAAV